MHIIGHFNSLQETEKAVMNFSVSLNWCLCDTSFIASLTISNFIKVIVLSYYLKIFYRAFEQFCQSMTALQIEKFRFLNAVSHVHSFHWVLVVLSVVVEFNHQSKLELLTKL